MLVKLPNGVSVNPEIVKYIHIRKDRVQMDTGPRVMFVVSLKLEDGVELPVQYCDQFDIATEASVECTNRINKGLGVEEEPPPPPPKEEEEEEPTPEEDKTSEDEKTSEDSSSTDDSTNENEDPFAALDDNGKKDEEEDPFAALDDNGKKEEAEDPFAALNNTDDDDPFAGL